jgi:hypothetical protein
MGVVFSLPPASGRLEIFFGPAATAPACLNRPTTPPPAAASVAVVGRSSGGRLCHFRFTIARQVKGAPPPPRRGAAVAFLFRHVSVLLKGFNLNRLSKNPCSIFA